jgi:hypothetical protein
MRTALGSLAVVIVAMVATPSLPASASVAVAATHEMPTVNSPINHSSYTTPADPAFTSGIKLIDTYHFTHTFSINRHGTAKAGEEVCTGVINFGKSTTYPGFIQGSAWVTGCIPEAPVFCTQTADMQTQNSSGGWSPDGDGPTISGCLGQVDSSVIRKDCTATRFIHYYRTQGIFTAQFPNIPPIDWSKNTKKTGLTRIC